MTRRLCLQLVFRLTCYDLDSCAFILVGVIHLEFDVLDDESPDFVAEAVRVEVALLIRIPCQRHELPIACSPLQQPNLSRSEVRSRTHLERKPGLDLLAQHLGDHLVEILHDAHCKLRLDAPAANQVIECVC